MKAIRFEQFGEPDQVLKYVEIPEPEPGPGEVRVRMIASPINPSDLLVVRGRYGVLPTLPASPGFEGVGVVEKAGGGIYGRFLVGKRVGVLNSAGGNWAEKAVIPAIRAIPVPSDIPDEQVASFFVNPATVIAMARHVLKVPKGSWLLQSAAGSTLGKMMIKLAKRDGFKTLNVVRRHEAIDELKALGGDAVISSSDGPIEDQVMAITGGKGVQYAIDPVGGETGSAVFRCLGSDSHMLVYGLLSNENIAFDPRAMIAGKRVIEGFWLGHWMASRSKLKSLALFREVFSLIREGVLATESGQAMPLINVAEAVRAAEVVGRHGKVLLTCS
jgi:NADPH:quinone reductase-like Zn-dependent oxidoreductase